MRVKVGCVLAVEIVHDNKREIMQYILNNTDKCTDWMCVNRKQTEESPFYSILCVWRAGTDKLVCRERSQTLLTPGEENGPGRDVLAPAGEAGMPYQYVTVHLVSWSLDTLQCICHACITLKENKRDLGEEVCGILLVLCYHLWLPGLVPCSQSPNTTCCTDSVVQYPDTSSPTCLSAYCSNLPQACHLPLRFE